MIKFARNGAIAGAAAGAGAGAAATTGAGAAGAGNAAPCGGLAVSGFGATGARTDVTGRGGKGAVFSAPRAETEGSTARGMEGPGPGPGAAAGLGAAAVGAVPGRVTTPEGVGFAVEGGVAFSGGLIKGSRRRAAAWLDKGKIEPAA